MSCGCAKEAEGGPVPKGGDTRGVHKSLGNLSRSTCLLAGVPGKLSLTGFSSCKQKPNLDGANGSLSRCEGRVKSEEGNFPPDSGNCGENAKQRPIGGERGPASRHGPCLTRCLVPLVSNPIYPPALTHLALLTWESLPHTPLPPTLAQEP